MVAFLHRQRLTLPIATLAGVVAGMIVALMFLVIPIGMIENLVIDSGIASVLSDAAPPLGDTARFALVAAGGCIAGATIWYSVFLAVGQRPLVVSKGDPADRTPILRRADAHPDAPARRPLSALRDLGTSRFEPISFPPIDEADLRKLDETAVGSPLIQDITPERQIPADLNQPLAAFDPDAILASPSEWSPAPPSLVAPPRKQVFDPGERFETFELTPVVRRTPPIAPVQRLAEPRVGDPSDSIHALLDRLERSVGKADRMVTPSSDLESLAMGRRADSIEDALISLRRLATRA